MSGMTIRVRFELNPKGIGEVLRYKGLQELLLAKGERVREAATANIERILWKGADPVQVAVQNHTGSRARVRIVALDGRAKALEAEGRCLGRAIDAAR